MDLTAVWNVCRYKRTYLYYTGSGGDVGLEGLQGPRGTKGAAGFTIPGILLDWSKQ